MEDHLQNLNREQKEAALHKEGPLLVVAGAGAGKTKTITHRICNLVKSGTDPASILAVTFTNKAAEEMKNRISALLLKDRALNLPISNHQLPFVGTFHALGAHILREKGALINIHKRFVIKDKDDCRTLVKNIIRDLGYSTDTYEPRKILNIISRNKGELIDCGAFGGEFAPQNFFQNVLVQVWTAYEQVLAREHALDFDDLILKTVFLLQENNDVRAYYQSRWQYIHVDEYQDTNRAQYELSYILGEKHKNICVVGDIDQCIYGWRGASMKNLLGFEKDYPNAKIIFLEENYRSTEVILKAANEVIKKNKLRVPKNLFTNKKGGEKISLFVSPTGGVEALRVATMSSELIERGVKPEDIAVLYRVNFESRALEEACLSSGVPYQVIGTRFFERKEVKDIISFIRAARNPESLGDIKRIINIPPRGIGKVTIAKIFSGKKNTLPKELGKKVDDFYSLLQKIHSLSEEKSPDKLITYILKETAIEKALKNDGREGEERLLNMKELVTFATRYAKTMPRETPLEQLEKFLEDAALATDQDSLLKNKGGIRLMTVHASKGLEFPYIFIVGLEEGLFPHARVDEDGPALIKSSNALHQSSKASEAMEEERRLFYVALTRAEKKLFLSYAETRIMYGQLEVNTPSEFLGDIPPELIEIEQGREDAFEEKIEYD